MGNITSIDRDKRRNRRASDNARSSGSQSRFNPLHPSHELPPEHLIRLMGLEDKQSRKKHKRASASGIRPEAPLSPPPTEPPPPAEPAGRRADAALPRLEVPTDHQMYRKRRQRTDTPPFPSSRSGLLMKAGGIGLVVGIAVAAYLFWWPENSGPDAPAVAGDSRPAPIVDSAPARAPQARDVLPVIRENPVTKKAAASTPTENPAWQAAIKAQERRLHAEAKQRLQAQLRDGQTHPLAAPEAAPVTSPPQPVAPSASPAPAMPPVESTPSVQSETIENTPATVPTAKSTATPETVPPAVDAVAPPEPAPVPETPAPDTDQAVQAVQPSDGLETLPDTTHPPATDAPPEILLEPAVQESVVPESLSAPVADVPADDTGEVAAPATLNAGQGDTP